MSSRAFIKIIISKEQIEELVFLDDSTVRNKVQVGSKIAEFYDKRLCGDCLNHCSYLPNGKADYIHALHPLKLREYGDEVSEYYFGDSVENKYSKIFSVLHKLQKFVNKIYLSIGIILIKVTNVR